MKKQLPKKVYAILIMMIFCVTVSNAQIIYTDLNPDITATRSPSPSAAVNYSIDFNNDGIVDVNLSSYGVNSRQPINPPRYYDIIAAIAISSSEILRVTSIITSNASQLNTNTIIEAASEFWSGSTFKTDLVDNDPTTCQNCWPFAADRFLGVRFSVGGNWFYGWVRISLSAFRSYTIKDYAFNSSPNQPILAGETGTLGLNENPLVSKINIFPNPASSQVTISLGSLQSEVEVAITDTTGKIVYKTKESERQNIKVNTTDFANGIYLVQIKAKDYVTTKKLVVNK